MNSETLIHRQVHPSLVVKEDVSSKVFEIASSVFTPTKDDEKKLSVYNGDKFSDNNDLEHFIKSRPSSGSLSQRVEDWDDKASTVSEVKMTYTEYVDVDFSGEEAKN